MMVPTRMSTRSKSPKAIVSAIASRSSGSDRSLGHTGGLALSPDHRSDTEANARFPPARPQPGLCDPRHGRDLDAGRHADRARRAARRRQRAGCRGGRVRRAVRDRAAIHRHRRRLLLPLRAGRHRQGHRAERLRPRAGRRHDRLVRAAGHHRDRQHLGARRHRARRDQRLGDAAEGARPQGPGRAAAAGDPLRRRGLAGASRRWRGTGSGWRRSCARTARTRFLPGGEAPNAGDLFRNPALAETLRAIARHGAKAFYEGPVAADMVADAARARRAAHRGGFRRRPAQRRVRRADHAELARLRRVSSARRTARASSR